MALRNIVIGYNNSPTSTEALRYAVHLCTRHGAALTGLHVRPPLTEEPQIQTWMPNHLIEALRSASRENAEAAAHSFHAVAREQDPEVSLGWIAEVGDVNDHLARIGRHFDLVVIGQYSDARDTSRFRVRAENIVMRSGRPLLVIPTGYDAVPDPEDRIAVAWDGGRPAARALNDAIQFFGANNRFDVISVTPQPPDERPGTTGHDILQHLLLHGVDARSVHVPGSKGDVAGALLLQCAVGKLDLLVMGAFSHARLREDVFGGVTKQVLQRMNIPVLLSH